MKIEKTNAFTHRVIAMLDRKEMDFLDKLGNDALFSTGHNLSYNQVIKGLVDIAMEAGVSGENVDSFQKLKERLAEVFPAYIQKLREEQNEAHAS